MLDGDLYLVAKEDISSSELNVDKLQIAISASVSENEDITMNSNSDEVIATLDIKPTSRDKYIKLTTLQTYVDPLIISLRDDGTIPLVSHESSNITFKMIPGLDKLKTGWIQNESESYESGFLILNSDVGSQDDINISSVVDLFSEYFQASNSKRTFKTGSDSLKSLDTNNDSKINKEDDEWNSLGIWFDNGDAISGKDEIIGYHILSKKLI